MTLSPAMTRTYAGLFLTVIVLRLILFAVPIVFVLPNQEQLISVQVIVMTFLLGFLGLRLGREVGFTEFWDSRVTQTQRFLLPACMGLGFGIISMLFSRVQLSDPEAVISLPASLLFYPIRGILEEILFRLLITTGLVWIISKYGLQGKGQAPVFWVIAIAVAGLYTYQQINQYLVATGQPADLQTVVRFAITTGAYFFTAAVLYRKYGFLSALSLRLPHDLVFHILWGGFLA